MKIEVRIEIDDVVCEAEVIDPHGNVEQVVAPELDTLMERLSVVVLSTYNACSLADEENA